MAEITFDVLNIDNLFKVKSHVLHLSGHGSQQELVTEDEWGRTRMIKNEDIKKLMFSGSKTKLVFISMCNSGMVAEHFVKMGVEHVVAVDCQQKVKESVAMSFAQQFYSHVFRVKLSKLHLKRQKIFVNLNTLGRKYHFYYYHQKRTWNIM
eukprot:UN31667